jgi:hypothetical protein
VARTRKTSIAKFRPEAYERYALEKDRQPGGRLFTQKAFVPAGLPATDFVTGSISRIDIIRGGGNGFYEGSAGALQVGVMTENVNGLALRNIDILSPTNFGIAFQFNPTVEPPPGEGTITSVLLRDVQVVAAPICAEVVAPLSGNAEFANVCSCGHPAGAASSARSNISGRRQRHPRSRSCPPRRRTHARKRPAVLSGLRGPRGRQSQKSSNPGNAPQIRV